MSRVAARKVVIIFCFLLFLGIMDYPFLSRIYNDRVSGDVINQYDENALSLSEITKRDALAAAQAYNERLSDGTDNIVYSNTGEEKDEEYESLLNIWGDGVMATVSIPAIDVDLPIYHGTSLNVLLKGAGHIEGSSLPIGGESTHAVITAHSGLPGKTFFTSLDLLEEGDMFYINVLGDTLAYEVYSIEVVLPDDISSLGIIPGEDIVTLVTCTPYGINSHRLLVHGERVPNDEAAVISEEEGQTFMSFLREWWWVLLNILLLLWLVFLLRVMNKRKNA